MTKTEYKWNRRKISFSRIQINKCKNNDRNSLPSGKHRSNSRWQQSATDAKVVSQLW